MVTSIWSDNYENCFSSVEQSGKSFNMTQTDGQCDSRVTRTNVPSIKDGTMHTFNIE